MAGRKLGRGLDLLIGKGSTEGGIEVLRLDPDEIEPNPEQPRQEFSASELESLKSSISRDGVLQPVLVRRVGERYQLVAGERRWRASKELRLDGVPAIVVAADDDRMLELALVENIQRANLSPIEVARAFQQMMEARGLTQDALARAVGVSRSSVANTLRLLDLPGEIQEALAHGRITAGHAKILVTVEDPLEQRQLFERIAEEKLSVRELEGQREDLDARRGSDGGRKKPRPGTRKTPQVISMEEELAEALGTKVTISEGKGKGRIVVEFYSSDDFQRIRDVIVGGAAGR